MKLTNNLSIGALFLISLAMALMGCDGGGGVGTPDAIQAELETDPDCDNPYGCVNRPDVNADTTNSDGFDTEEEPIEPMPEKFLWWAANWKCVSIETCDILGEYNILTLEVDRWDSKNHVAHFYGLAPCDNWEITHDGTAFTMTGYTQDGVMTCQLKEVNGNIAKFSWTENGEPRIYPWNWERQ